MIYYKEPTAQQKTGKGTEFLVATKLSVFFGIKFDLTSSNRQQAYDTNEHCYKLWSSEQPGRVAKIESEIDKVVIPSLINKYGNERPQRLWFNTDDQGQNNDVRDIVFSDRWDGLSLKNNNKEIKSSRHRNEANSYETIFGNIPSKYFCKDFETIKQLYPENRIAFSLWLDKRYYYHAVCSAVIAEIQRSNDSLVANFNKFVLGLDFPVNFVKFNKSGICLFEGKNHIPLQTYVGVSGKYMKCKKIINTVKLEFIDKESNTVFIDIRVKNGNTNTHSIDGSPYGLKTSITKYYN